MKRRDILRRVLAAGLCLCMCLGFVEAALPVWADAPDSADSVPATDVPTDVPATDVPTEAPATEPPVEEPAPDEPGTEPAPDDPAVDESTEAPATEPPVEEPAPDEPEAEPAPDGPVVDVPSASPEPTDEPSESPEPVEKTVFTVIHHYPDDGDEAYPMEEPPEGQEDTPVEPIPVAEATAAPEEAQETDPPTGEIMPDGTVYVYETGETYPAPYIVWPEPLTDEDGNVLAQFSSFTAEAGAAAVAIELEDPEDPATICAKISYEPNTPQVTLHVYYEDNGIATTSIGEDPNAETVKKYFVDKNYVGTYVTKRHEDGQSYDCWSIVIKEDGDVALCLDGVDTEATATFNSVSAGRPGSIVFSHEGWYLNETDETGAKLTVTLDSNGFFTMPDYQIYWAKDDGTGENYSFSKAPHYYNKTILEDYFKDFQGEYTLSDGSRWKMTIDADGGMTMSSTDEKANNAFVDYFTMNSARTTFSTVVFSSPDWYSTKNAAYQTLTLTWTPTVSSKYDFNSFKVNKAVTFYEVGGKMAFKGFNTYSYFIPATGIYSYTYFAEQNEDSSKKYVGKYALSSAYGTVYGDDIDGIGGWYIEINDTGHVYLHTGGEQREAVMTAVSSDRVTTMYVCVPGLYTDKTCVTPAFIKLTWTYNSTAKDADLYFTADTIATAYKLEGGKIVKTFIPPMNFERGDRTAFAKSKLSAADEDGNKLYVGKYYANDDPEEYIEIKEDGSVVLHTGDGTELTPLYYNIDTKWIKTPESADVTSVVFSAPNWFDANKKAAENDRQTVTMTWNATNKQFTAEEKTCYKPESTEVVRTYTVNTKFTRNENNKEAAAYFEQYVEGKYTLNDGSGWKIKVEKDETDDTWKIYTNFDGGEYEVVKNPAAVFTYDKNHTASSSSEWGNDGRYLDNITVPVDGWFTDEACTRKAIVTLTWNGKLTNPIDDHQFKVGLGDETTGYALYRMKDGVVECKYMTGTFYSDTDRESGKGVLAAYAGTYHPTEAAGKWYIDIAADGTVTVTATDSKGGEHTHTDVALDITMDKSKKNDTNPDFGVITGVTDIKVVIPEWRTVQTNDTLANIAQCGEVTFTLVPVVNGSSYFTPSKSYIYADTKEGGASWEVVKKGAAGYNKDLITKIYDNDRAYSDDNKAKAKEYFAKYAGTYLIEDASVDYQLTVTDEGEIYWGDLTSVTEPMAADVQFDAIRDDNEDGKVNDGEDVIVPGTISVWLNGYTTGRVSSSSSATYNDGIQRADFTWSETNEEDVPYSAHKFKSKSAKGYKVGSSSQTSFAADKYYTLDGAEGEGTFAEDGKYETTDGKYWIEVKTEGEETSYTFHRPEPNYDYPLKLFGSGDKAYLRGLIGKMKKNDIYIVITRIPGDAFKNFLFTAYEVEYNDLEGKQVTSSSAPTVVLPAMTRFTNYAATDDGAVKNFVVAEPGEDVNTGTAYSRLSLALHNLHGGETIYLKDNVEIDFEAKLPDDVGEITIDGQGHTIKRGTHVIPSLVQSISADPVLLDILSDPDVDPEPILAALEAEDEDEPAPVAEDEEELERVEEPESEDGPEPVAVDTGLLLTALEETGEGTEHYTGAILQVGEEDTVTLKDVTIDGEGQWEWNNELLEFDKELNKDYDVNVLEAPGGGHPITVKDGNVTSTESLIKVNGGTLNLDNVVLENFFAGDGYDDDRHFIDFMSKEEGVLNVEGATFRKNASRSGVCIGNTDKDTINLGGSTLMQNNYCYGGNGGLVVAMEGTQVYMSEGTKIIDNVAADTNGIFIQLHKKTDGVKDGDNKGEIYAKLTMNGGYIHNNVGLRGGSYGWGQTIYLYNGGAFEMNGGDICCNMGAGISSIYQQPSADEVKLTAGHIHNNTCSLKDIDWALDIALMNLGTLGEGMIVEQNFVVGAAAILGGYASGDEYLTNNGEIHGNISVYSYFNNEGNVSTVVNNNLIDGDIRLENGSMVKNAVGGYITGNVTIRGALTESAGESSLHNEGRIDGNIELAENTHFYNSGELYGNVTVKSGATLEMNCNEEGHTHGGTIHGDVTIYPGGLIYADVTPTLIDGTVYFEYEDEDDLELMEEVLKACGIVYSDFVAEKHEHTVGVDDDGNVTGKWDEIVIEPDDDYLCTDPTTKQYVCQTCGEVVATKETEPTGHKYYLDRTDEATCTTGMMEYYRCEKCSAYNSTAKELKFQVGDPLGHEYEEKTELYIPPTEYGSGHLYYVCNRCGKLLEFEIPPLKAGATTHSHSFQNPDGSLNDKADGVEIEPASCTKAGKITFKCQDGCGTEIEIEIPATGHRYPDPTTANPETDYDHIEHKDSTCTTAGYDKYAPKCTVCYETSDTYKYQVNLPKLEHKWTEWADVDAGPYLCTEERKQERECKLCSTTEERLGGEKNHNWDPANPDVCSDCGYNKAGYHIDYRLNGGTAPKSLADISGKVYTSGSTISLWQPSSQKDDEDAGLKDGVWTKQTADGQAVFVGWSDTDPGAAPLEAKHEAGFISSVVIPADTDAVVFAVWAVDRNKNNKADYDDKAISIIYDANGGDGTVPDTLTNVLPGGTYPLETAPGLTKDGNLFAGWSETQYSDAIKGHTDPGDIDMIKSLVASPFEVPEGTTEDIKLYAVYAVDADGTGKPDYCERALHVEYYINGGQVRDGYTVATDKDHNGMFYVCNDYHMPGTDATLLKVEYGAEMIYREKAVLIGWSAGPVTNLVTKREPDAKDKDKYVLKTDAGEVAEPITTVSLTGAESNAKVYAVWAADENENHVADYTETLLMHTYHQNQFLSYNGSRTIEVGWRLVVNKDDVPPRENNVLPGMGVELAAGNALGGIDGADLVDENNAPQEHYVQVGWSAISHGVCKSEKDYKDWVIEGDDYGYTQDGKYYRLIRDSRDRR